MKSRLNVTSVCSNIFLLFARKILIPNQVVLRLYATKMYSPCVWAGYG